jgi:hypothetical protein
VPRPFVLASVHEPSPSPPQLELPCLGSAVILRRPKPFRTRCSSSGLAALFLKVDATSPRAQESRPVDTSGEHMGTSETAKLFRHGRSQAVRLRKSFRLPGTGARVRRLGRGCPSSKFLRQRAA